MLLYLACKGFRWGDVQVLKLPLQKYWIKVSSHSTVLYPVRLDMVTRITPLVLHT